MARSKFHWHLPFDSSNTIAMVMRSLYKIQLNTFTTKHMSLERSLLCSHSNPAFHFDSWKFMEKKSNTKTCTIWNAFVFDLIHESKYQLYWKFPFMQRNFVYLSWIFAKYRIIRVAMHKKSVYKWKSPTFLPCHFYKQISIVYINLYFSGSHIRFIDKMSIFSLVSNLQSRLKPFTSKQRRRKRMEQTVLQIDLWLRPEENSKPGKEREQVTIQSDE